MLFQRDCRAIPRLHGGRLSWGEGWVMIRAVIAAYRPCLGCVVHDPNGVDMRKPAIDHVAGDTHGNDQDENA
jgi:hypothetical protein